MSLPELTGTEKQVTWANTIRVEFINKIHDVIEESCFDNFDEEEQRAEYRANRTAPIDYLIKRHTDARFWIDNRGSYRSIELIAKEEYKKHVEEVENLGQTLEESVKDETVTVEPEEKMHGGVVKLVIKKGTVRAIYPKDADFMKIVKSKGLKWGGITWGIEIIEYTGTAEDIIAELGNDFLNNGFAVQFPNKQCKDKAVSGDFEPLNDKWIKWSEKRQKLAIEWPGYNDEMYQMAKRLPDAQWRGWMTVPVEYYKEVLDFADINGFSISKKANAKIEEYKAKEAGFEKVNAVKIEQPEDVDKLKEILEKSGAIEDLIDED
ncbi:hypothetical protein [Muricomes intestini]|uniref:hypothetical protein n=1 Tax=Muricomes intestini TaxID=1796634 RepID=UPI002FDE242D